MEDNNQINRINETKNFHIIVSGTNYNKLKSLGKMGDSFDKVLGELLLKNQMLESDSEWRLHNHDSNSY